jgi:diaminopimelate decarboxylase
MVGEFGEPLDIVDPGTVSREPDRTSTMLKHTHAKVHQCFAVKSPRETSVLSFLRISIERYSHHQ